LPGSAAAIPKRASNIASVAIRVMRMGASAPLQAEPAAARKLKLAVGAWRRGDALEARKQVGETGTLRSG
jgi:hypothetical protein